MAYSHGPEARVVKVKKAKDFFNTHLNEPNNLLENGRLNLRVIQSFPQQEFPVDQETTRQLMGLSDVSLSELPRVAR